MFVFNFKSKPVVFDFRLIETIFYLRLFTEKVALHAKIATLITTTATYGV